MLWLAYGSALVGMRIFQAGQTISLADVSKQLATVLAVLKGSVGMI